MMTKLREDFESWYRGLMGTPDNVLKNLRSGDSYSETDGERLNIAWHAYQSASKASKPVDMRHIGHATVQVSGQRYPYLDKGDVLHVFKEIGIRIRTKDSDPAEGVEVTL